MPHPLVGQAIRTVLGAVKCVGQNSAGDLRRASEPFAFVDKITTVHPTIESKVGFKVEFEAEP